MADHHREALVSIANETLQISEDGIYEAVDGEVYDITDMVRDAVANTVVFTPQEMPPERFQRDRYETRFSVELETTLYVARQLHAAGVRPLALNFASARNPGGGFQRGSMAQEQSLAYASALYMCLVGREMYWEHPTGSNEGLYDDYVIYSPNVPVFRDDEHVLIEPWPCSFITSAAPNAATFVEQSDNHREARKRVAEVFYKRAAKVLTIAANAGHEHLVLGAWGCGAFGCDPDMVAMSFYQLLQARFHGTFREVVFAIKEDRPSHPTVAPFFRRFSAQA